MSKFLRKFSEKSDLAGGLAILFTVVPAAMILALIGTLLFNRYMASLPPDKEWGIVCVEQMPYVQGEHKQEILNQINEANQNGEVQGIVCQAQKDNDAIRVIVAARHVNYCDEGIMSDGHYVCWDGKVSHNSKESE